MTRRISQRLDPIVDWDRLHELGPLPSGYEIDGGESPIRAKLQGSSGLFRVHRLSPEILHLDSGRFRAPALGARLEATLVAGYGEHGPFPVVVEGRGGRGGRSLLRLRFVEVRRESGQRIINLLRWMRSHRHAISSQPVAAASDLIDDERTIFRGIRSLFCHHSVGLLQAESGVPWPATCHTFAEGETLPLRMRVPSPPLDLPLRASIVGYNSTFTWTVSQAERIGGLLHTDVPKRVLRSRHRWRRRAVSPPGLSVAFRHPLWPEVDLCRTLRDLSTQGVGFWTFADDDLLYPGLYIPEAEMIYHGEVVCSGELLIRHISEMPPMMHSAAADDTVAGAAFRPSGAGDDARWLNLVNRLLNPNTRSGATWADFTWDVYEDSGYFHLSGKSPDKFASLRRTFERVSRSIDASPWIGCQAVWPSERGVEATFTFIKAYVNSWIGFQLARKPASAALRAPSRQILRELYLRVFEHMQHDPELEWVAGYLDASVRWNQAAQFAFARSHAASGLACLIPFVLMECDSRSAATAAQVLPDFLERIHTMLAPKRGEDGELASR